MDNSLFENSRLEKSIIRLIVDGKEIPLKSARIGITEPDYRYFDTFGMRTIVVEVETKEE